MTLEEETLRKRLEDWKYKLASCTIYIEINYYYDIINQNIYNISKDALFMMHFY